MDPVWPGCTTLLNPSSIGMGEGQFTPWLSKSSITPKKHLGYSQIQLCILGVEKKMTLRFTFGMQIFLWQTFYLYFFIWGGGQVASVPIAPFPCKRI